MNNYKLQNDLFVLLFYMVLWVVWVPCGHCWVLWVLLINELLCGYIRVVMRPISPPPSKKIKRTKKTYSLITRSYTSVAKKLYNLSHYSDLQHKQCKSCTKVYLYFRFLSKRIILVRVKQKINHWTICNSSTALTIWPRWLLAFCLSL